MVEATKTRGGGRRPTAPAALPGALWRRASVSGYALPADGPTPCASPKYAASLLPSNKPLRRTVDTHSQAATSGH